MRNMQESIALVAIVFLFVFAALPSTVSATAPLTVVTGGNISIASIDVYPILVNQLPVLPSAESTGSGSGTQDVPFLNDTTVLDILNSTFIHLLQTSLKPAFTSLDVLLIQGVPATSSSFMATSVALISSLMNLTSIVIELQTQTSNFDLDPSSVFFENCPTVKVILSWPTAGMWGAQQLSAISSDQSASATAIWARLTTSTGLNAVVFNANLNIAAIEGPSWQDPAVQDVWSTFRDSVFAEEQNPNKVVAFAFTDSSAPAAISVNNSLWSSVFNSSAPGAAPADDRLFYPVKSNVKVVKSATITLPVNVSSHDVVLFSILQFSQNSDSEFTHESSDGSFPFLEITDQDTLLNPPVFSSSSGSTGSGSFAPVFHRSLLERDSGCETIDACGVCDGDNSTCTGCDGIVVGLNTESMGLYAYKTFDVCGICGGDGLACAGCDGLPFSEVVLDVCGMCGGNATDATDCEGNQPSIPVVVPPVPSAEKTASQTTVTVKAETDAVATTVTSAPGKKFFDVISGGDQSTPGIGGNSSGFATIMPILSIFMGLSVIGTAVVVIAWVRKQKRLSQNRNDESERIISPLANILLDKAKQGELSTRLSPKLSKRQQSSPKFSKRKSMSSSGLATSSNDITGVSSGTLEQSSVRAVALFPYKASAPDEISFLKGENVLVLERFDDGWALGKRTTEPITRGVFPLNHVQLS